MLRHYPWLLPFINVSDELRKYMHERMNERTNGRMEGWTNGRTGEWTNRQMDEWTKGRMNELTDRRTDEQRNGRADERMNRWMNEWNEMIVKDIIIQCREGYQPVDLPLILLITLYFTAKAEVTGAIWRAQKLWLIFVDLKVVWFQLLTDKEITNINAYAKAAKK